jgi:phage shock protein B
MDDNVTALLIVALSFLFVICLRYLKFRTQNGSRLNQQDVQAVEQMAQIAQRLEQRVVTLERILDAEVPSWRSRPETAFRQAG